MTELRNELFETEPHTPTLPTLIPHTHSPPMNQANTTLDGVYASLG